jgi:hypothetical protein
MELLEEVQEHRGFCRQDPRGEIEKGNTNAGAIGIPAHGVEQSEAGNLPNPKHETAEYDLYQSLTDAAKETEVDWPESFVWKQTKRRIAEISLGSLLFAALVGFAIACWQALGYVYAAIFSSSI